ncbi:MAG TPA: biotin/lipoyl-containing protein [Ktedonobacteraceae bacterium]
MDIREREMPWVKRVEALIEALDGSTVGEFELREAGTEIIIRRRPDLVLTSSALTTVQVSPTQAPGGGKAGNTREDRSQPVPAPLTGVYYSSPSPNSPPFVNIGDVIHIGQIVALIEAMKVFNEIQSEVAGRVISLVAKNGDVVQKGSALLKVEPL